MRALDGFMGKRDVRASPFREVALCPRASIFHLCFWYLRNLVPED